MSLQRFAGQVALVTGGSSGIGRAAALAFASEGAAVVISIGGWSGHIEMTNPQGKKGRIDIKNAILERYTLEGQTGDEVLRSLLSWNRGKFKAERN